MKLASTLSAALCLAVLSPLAAGAASVTFNFDSLRAGNYLQPSQVLVPDIGTGQTALVNILNANNANQTFNIVDSYLSSFKNPPPSGNTNLGNNIQEVEGSKEALQLVFSHPIYTFSMTFSVIPGATTPPPVNINPLMVTSYLTANSAAPTATVLGTGDTYSSTHIYQYYGILTLQSSIAFSVIDIGLFNPNVPSNVADTYAFDDLIADDTPTVPEPGAIALGLALALPAAWLRKRKSAKSNLR